LQYWPLTDAWVLSSVVFLAVLLFSALSFKSLHDCLDCHIHSISIKSSVDIMAMVNTLANVKDSRWLQLEVCREYQRNKCSRPDQECKFAHPPHNVEVQNGRVIACYDSIKGRCNREKPPCKYFHPPQHLKDQLLINGRNHLALKNALLQQMPLQTVLTGQLPVATSYVTNLPAVASASAYGAYPAAVLPGLMSAADHLTTNYGVVPTTTLIASHKTTRTDRLEVCREFQRGNCKRAESDCRFAHPPDHVQVDATDGVVTTFPGVMPFSKRPALEKSGMPVYQPAGTAAYQQALAMHQSFVPLSFYYPVAGHPNSVPRF
jgi:muscleblind protein